MLFRFTFQRHSRLTKQEATKDPYNVDVSKTVHPVLESVLSEHPTFLDAMSFHCDKACASKKTCSRSTFGNKRTTLIEDNLITINSCPFNLVLGAGRNSLIEARVEVKQANLARSCASCK